MPTRVRGWRAKPELDEVMDLQRRPIPLVALSIVAICNFSSPHVHTLTCHATLPHDGGVTVPSNARISSAIVTVMYRAMAQDQEHSNQPALGAEDLGCQVKGIQ